MSGLSQSDSSSFENIPKSSGSPDQEKGEISEESKKSNAIQFWNNLCVEGKPPTQGENKEGKEKEKEPETTKEIPGPEKKEKCHLEEEVGILKSKTISLQCQVDVLNQLLRNLELNVKKMEEDKKEKVDSPSTGCNGISGFAKEAIQKSKEENSSSNAVEQNRNRQNSGSQYSGIQNRDRQNSGSQYSGNQHRDNQKNPDIHHIHYSDDRNRTNHQNQENHHRQDQNRDNLYPYNQNRNDQYSRGGYHGGHQGQDGNRGGYDNRQDGGHYNQSDHQDNRGFSDNGSVRSRNYAQSSQGHPERTHGRYFTQRKVFRYICSMDYVDGKAGECHFCRNQHFEDSCPFVQDVQRRKEILDRDGICSYCLDRRCEGDCTCTDTGCVYCDRLGFGPKAHHRSICKWAVNLRYDQK